MRLATLIVLTLGLSACRNDTLSGILAQLRLEPARVDYGSAAIGQRLEKVVTVTNDSRAPVEVEWSTLESPFAASEVPTRLAPGSSTFLIVFEPRDAGVFTAELTLSLTGERATSTTLSGEGRVVQCRAPDACHLSVLSPETGSCVVTSAPNGTSCGGESLCLEAGQCVDGECRGTPFTCADEDHCTIDGCTPGLGCTHSPLTCPGVGECMAGGCDPSSGCTLVAREDGTTCGTQRTCTAADVCIAGACVERDPPEGFICAERSPCQERGVCVDDLCVQPAPAPLTASWDFDGRLPDGGPGRAWSDALITDHDEVVLSSYFGSAPVLHANRADPVTLRSNARRCIVWHGWLMCADLPGAGVSANDLETGEQVWVYTSVRNDVAQLSQPGIETFLARLVALSPTRLGVVFESRTISTTGADTMCRRFSYVVLNERGEFQNSALLADPIFEVCNHPHSFGAAVDATGTLYLAFWPSGSSNPATPIVESCDEATPTCRVSTFIALNAQAGVRWKRIIPGSSAAGELAVANGRLFIERSTEVLSTQTGATLAQRTSPFGMGLASTQSIVNAPEPASLSATLHSFAPSWEAKPDLTQAFVANQLQAATWQTSGGPRSVALGLKVALNTESSSDLMLFAVDLETGAQAFQCQLRDTRDPHLFHIGSSGMVLMSRDVVTGLASCERCDPRFAASRNRFQWFDLPTVHKGRVTWNGAYGDAHHSHQEYRP